MLGILAFAVLFAAATNYVLISIATLAARFKSVGVHKCSGASEAHVFGMFIYETLVLLVLALVFSGLLIYAFRMQIETWMQHDLATIFSPQNWWVIVLIFVFLLVVTGGIPARMMAAVPVTQVFAVCYRRKTRWKQALLFVQLAGMVFGVVLLAVIFSRYRTMMSKELGYNKENVLHTALFDYDDNQLKALRSQLLAFPEVISATRTSSLPYGCSGNERMDDTETGKELAWARITAADKDFIPTFGIRLNKGRLFDESFGQRGEVLINASFAAKLPWSDPIGRRI